MYFLDNGDFTALACEDILLVTSQSSVHAQALLLVCIGIQMGKLIVWFLEFLSNVLHFQVCLINITNNLENIIKMVICIVFQEYMIRMLLTFC